MKTPTRVTLTDEQARLLGFKITEGKRKRYRLKPHHKRLLYGLDNNEEDELKEAKERKYDKTKQYFIVSWAQIDTDINVNFMNNIKKYADDIDASIHIIAGRYKNPTSLSKSNQVKSKESKASWHPLIAPYLDANRHKIHKHLCVLSDVKVQPTAGDPLSGLNGLTALESCIIGHPHLYFKSLPVLPNYPSKVLLTTGAVTKPNYTDTKVGKKAEFHHTYGFAIVELDGKHFHVRQVSADKNGNFYDMNRYYGNGKLIKAKNYPGIVLGDSHLGSEDKKKNEASFKLIDKIGFKKIIVHDIFDGKRINHHEKHNPFLLLQRENRNELNLKDEIDYMLNWFNDRKKYNFVSIASNHNDFLDRWLMSNDWRENNNKETYLELALLKVRNPNKSVVSTLLSQFSHVKSIEYGESYRILDIELGLHGDKGANGSRGSANQFKNLNTKTISGHTHSPSRQLGSVIVGTSTLLDLGYNIGLCSWMHTDAIIYPNGKVSLINFVNGKFSTLL